MNYPEVLLFIDGVWSSAASQRFIPVTDPASEAQIGRVAHAGPADIDAAVEAANRGMERWLALATLERAGIMREAARLLRERADAIAPILTREQGKPLRDALSEVRGAAGVIEWFADESRRIYGRTIPPREIGASAIVHRVPVGVVAGFCPWNYPISQAVRKISAALAAGCSIVVKAAEETPASTAMMVDCFADAGVPRGAVNLLFGDPDTISRHLIDHPAVRAISFTGSTQVGRLLTERAGRQLKRCTMELGGHAPCLVFDDADLVAAVHMLAGHKYHNAGQVCIAPTRILVQSSSFSGFLDDFARQAREVVVGPGLDEATQMGPLAHARRVEAVQDLVDDALAHGADLVTGGRRRGNSGHFFEPTVLANVPPGARIMNEEPFGPVAIVNPFSDAQAAIAEANRLPYGLAAYGFSRSAKTIQRMSHEVVAGMVSINHYGLAWPEVPFGGVRDSGFGNEGGLEALNDFLDTKYVSSLTI